MGLFLSVAMGAAAVTPGDPRIAFTHGSDVIARCTGSSPQEGAFCFGMITGVFESVRAYETWLNIRELCVPASATLTDMRDVVVARIRAHPDDRLGQGASVIVLALKEKWPCAAAANAPATKASDPAQRTDPARPRQSRPDGPATRPPPR